ncbi:hypothetical protein [Usitatibacter rugosus]|nr:hypothetical protein [Usitatibacter rugosus]
MAAILLAIGAWIYSVVGKIAGVARRGKSSRRDEALFVSMFPDLQPHFHPERLVEFVRAQRSGKRAAASRTASATWKNPPGLGVHAVEIEPGHLRVPYKMRDESGALLGQFLYDEIPEGGVLRVGEGKLTVNVMDKIPRVRYWHPRREFKWSQKKGWAFATPLADAHDSDSSYSSSDSSSHSFSTSRDDGVSPAPVGGGGTFDGGGASGSWDDSTSTSTGTDTSSDTSSGAAAAADTSTSTSSSY